MNEAEFCTIIKNSFPEDYIYKIPDPSGAFSMTVKRTFDGIGMIEQGGVLHPFYWEAKYLPKASAFNFNRIEVHQDKYLRWYRKIPGAISWVIIGINFGRADKRVFILDWDEDFGKLYAKGFSIHKKFLEKLPYNEVHKGKFEPVEVISYKKLEEIMGPII